MAQPIYLDYNATTPVDPEVLEAMLPYFGTRFGNPSSKRHVYGWTADEAVTVAREQVASLVRAHPDWVRFTAGATEAINWAVKGFAWANERRGKHIVAVATEHKAVLASCEALARQGWEITLLGTDRHGRVSAHQVEGALRSDTVLLCCMWANNEIGAMHPVTEIADAAHRHGVAVLVDATQAVGKVRVTMGEIDLMTCSAHKFYGPKGVGALIINGGRPRLRLESLIDGGGQERGTRAGTSNVPGIVGMGAAAILAQANLDHESARLEAQRNRLETVLRERGVVMVLNGAAGPRLPNTSNVTFPGVDTARLLERLPGLALSTGSACSTGVGGPSHVLRAIGSDLESATLRISLGRFTTNREVETASNAIAQAVLDLQPVTEAS